MFDSSTLRSSGRDIDHSEIVSPHATGNPSTSLAQSEGSEQSRTSTPGRTRLRLTRPKPPADDGKRTRPPAKKIANKPPTKLTVKGGGILLQTTNGVETSQDDCSTPQSTPATHNSNGHTAQRSSARSEDKRVLRSQNGGSRLKSDLSIYFPNYDEIIGDAPKATGPLNAETDIFIIDDPTKVPELPPTSLPHGSAITSANGPAYTDPASPPQEPITSAQAMPAPTQLRNGAEQVDFSGVELEIPVDGEDPLSDETYLKAHRRAERKEKQLRNIEKERAMHEKVQLERLLDGLLGHDWLRVMGISGITDTEKKAYEPKRDYFIREVEALVEKFKMWRDEEKRQRLEREQAQLAAEEGAEDGDDVTTTNGDAPNSSDVDAWAARQLQQEASFASEPQRGRPRQKLVLKMPSPEPEFTSFYSKPYLREAAMGKHRRGRSKMAFGLPIPEPSQHEFALPEDYVSEEVLVANARKRRRLKRESRDAKPA